MHGVIVLIRQEFKGIDCPEKKIRALVTHICRRFKAVNSTVDIAIVGNDQMRKLNRRFLNHRAVTDCLAFDLSEPDIAHRLFEIIVNAELAVAQAAKRGHSPQAELALYVTHGLLHNLGFDDFTPSESKKMHQLEDKILQKQGFGRIYAHNSKMKPSKKHNKQKSVRKSQRSSR